VEARLAAPGLRWMALDLPAFSLERCGWSASDPVVLVAPQHGVLRVRACTPEARALGVEIGMRLTQARATADGIHVELYDPVGEAQDRHELTRAMSVLSDRVKPLDHQAWVVECSRLALWSSERDFLDHARAVLEGLGHHAVPVIAGSPNGALALARVHQEPQVVEPGQLGTALADLLLASVHTAQPLSESLLAEAQALGVRTLGDWAELDVASVSRRFGQEGVALHRLARGEPLSAWTALDDQLGPTPRSLLVEPPAENTERVLVAVERMLAEVQAELEQRHLGLTAFELWLAPERGAPIHLPVRLSRPASSDLLRRIGPRLEGLKLGAPVEAVGIDPQSWEPCRGQQASLWGREERREQQDDLLGRLRDVLGSQAVLRPALREAWAPEHSWGDQAQVATPADDPVEAMEAWERLPVAMRPTWLQQAKAVQVELNTDGLPYSAELDGTWRACQVVGEPEHLVGGWWRRDGGWNRRYYAVQWGGRAAWLMLERDQWFHVGWFD